MINPVQRLCLVLFALVGGLLLPHSTAQAETLSVGPGKTYQTPSQAAQAAKDGDIIEIEPGTYTDDCAVWSRDGLTIRGIGSRPLINSKGMAAEEKAIWVVKGDNTTIENVELTGCAVKDRNGAGIRQEGRNLIVRKCFIHDNENGIFASDNPQSQIEIEFCEFAHNGHGNGQSHNIYINFVRTLKVKGCYIHDANAGSNLKSRAQASFITYNRLGDDDSANTGLSLDFPNGGACYVVGNLIRKGKHSGNAAFVSVGFEGAKNLKQALYLVNNTIVSGRRGSTLFRAQGGTSLRIVDNVFLNVGKAFEASGTLELAQINHNIFASPRDFVDTPNFDFHLASRTDARHSGVSAGFADGIDLTPRFEYVQPCSIKARANGYDLGAFAGN